MASTIYAAAIAGTLVAGAITAFIIVIVIGGPITGMIYRSSSLRQRRE